MPTKWHYDVHRGALSLDAINEFGNKGWELVSVISEQGGPVFYFKRPHPSLKESITIEQRDHLYAKWGAAPDVTP